MLGTRILVRGSNILLSGTPSVRSAMRATPASMRTPRDPSATASRRSQQMLQVAAPEIDVSPRTLKVTCTAAGETLNSKSEYMPPSQVERLVRHDYITSPEHIGTGHELPGRV